jgi:AcrR family transcriptional regulator
MTSSSNSEVVLSAARECILATGWRRTTIADIARRAGISRMTIYRMWPDMSALLRDLMVREWSGVALPADFDVTPRSIAAAVVEGAEALRSNDLFRKLVDVDPELLLPYLTHRIGRTQRALQDQLEAGISTGQQTGAVRAGDSGLLAQTIMLAVQSHVVARYRASDEENSPAVELRLMIERYLAP